MIKRLGNFDVFTDSHGLVTHAIPWRCNSVEEFCEYYPYEPVNKGKLIKDFDGNGGLKKCAGKYSLRQFIRRAECGVACFFPVG